jgi:hypothetical protein
MIPQGTPKAKADSWALPDAKARKPGEQNGLDTRVVLAVNYPRWILGFCSESKLTR